MKEGFAEQKNKAFKRVAILLLAAWIAVSVVYSVVVYFIEFRNIVNNERVYEQKLLSVLNKQDEDYWAKFFKSIDGARQETALYTDGDGENEYDTNMQIVVSEKYKSGVIMDTGESISVVFSGRLDGEEDIYVEGLLNYDDFLESMTVEQYDEIVRFLGSVPYEEGKVYSLVCTEFYASRYGIRPKTVEIAARDPQNNWYMSGDVLKTYDLDVEYEADRKLFKMDNDHCNLIPTSFLLNRFGTNDLIEDIDEAVIAYHSPEKIAAEINNYAVECVGPFTYVYSNLNTILVQSEAENESKDTSDYGYQEIYIRYAKRFNVFAEAIDTIGIGLVIILIFFMCVCFLTFVMLNKVIEAEVEAAQKRRELTNSLAHDIKTPLFIISGYAENLRENINTDKREHYADRIIERTKEVNLIVHQILNLAKLDSPYCELVREDTDMGELVNDILTDYTNLPDNRSIKVNKKANCLVFVDKYAINRAIRNIIENAVKYSDKQTVINIEYDERALSISNVASGITDENVKHFTEAYYRADNSQNKEGSGLGLSAVKSITDMHGFNLDVRLYDNILTVRIVFRHR